MPDSGSLLHRRREALDQVARLRFQARWNTGLGVVYVVLAAAQWALDDAAGHFRWLRAFHRDRRRGLDGPSREATWAVVENAAGDGRDYGRVIGAVRLC